MLQPATTRYELIILQALDRLAQLDGLNTNEIALRCFITGRIPTTPAFTKPVIDAYARLELEQTRGHPSKAHAIA